MAAVVRAHKTGSRGDSEFPATVVRPRFQPGDVNRAIAIVRQKNVWARQACAIEIEVGRRYRTVRPPRIPCVSTAKNAITLRRRTHARDSFRQIQIIKMTVSKPTNEATKRWPCS